MIRSHSCLRWRAPELEWERDTSGDGRAASRFGRQFGPGVPGSARSNAGTAQPGRYVPRPHAGHGRNLFSQPTPSRPENAQRLGDVIHLTNTLVDVWMDSYQREPVHSLLELRMNGFRANRSDLHCDQVIWPRSIEPGGGAMPNSDRTSVKGRERPNFIGGSDARIIVGKDEKALQRLWREKRTHWHSCVPIKLRSVASQFAIERAS